MISGQTEADVACTEKAEVKTAQVSSQEEETVLLGKESESEVNETNFCLKTMAVLYKTATMLFFCGTFSYFMANEPEPLSVLEALTYQVMPILTPDKLRFQFSGAGPPLLPFNICLPR